MASATAVDFDDAAWDRVVLNAKTFAELAASKQPGAPALSYPAMTLLNGKHATAVYRTTVEITDADLRRGAVHLELAGVDDQGEIFVNGHSVGKTTDWRKPFDANISTAAHPGRNVIAVVVTNSDADGGISRPVTLYTSDDVLPLKCQLGDQLAGVVGHWWEPADASGWTAVSLDTATPLPTKGRLAVTPAPAKTLQKWVRAEFVLPAPQPHVWAPWSAVIHASGNGFVYLNGHNLGRYYDIGPQRQFYLPEPWLKTGDEKNVLTLSLTAAEGEPGLLGLELVPYADQAETR
ncbi:MAG: sugar-binding domain-containing protein [Tepidisphaeraceae bacterium]